MPKRYDHAIYTPEGEYVTNALLTLKEAAGLRSKGTQVKLAITGKTPPDHWFRSRGYVTPDPNRRGWRGQTRGY